jgi:hypothetical protein
MGGSSFDFIAQAILQQQRIMKELQEENRQLRRQLAELRAGHGIFVEIGGRQIALSQLIEDASHMQSAENRGNIAPVVAQETQQQPEIAVPVVASPTAATTEQLQPTDPRTPAFPEALPVTPTMQKNEQQAPTPAPSNFLEEMMVDEFSAAMTSQMAVWTGPVKQPEITDEEKKAALRKELMGSFLLE